MAGVVRCGQTFWLTTALTTCLFLVQSSTLAQVVTSPLHDKTNPKIQPKLLSPKDESELKYKDTFKECDVCPEMIVVPAGRFMMGLPKDEQSRNQIEGPQHLVSFAKPFAAGKFELTLGQFKAFANETDHETGLDCREDGPNGKSALSWRSPGFPQSDSHPVTCLSWDDFKVYTLWLKQFPAYLNWWDSQQARNEGVFWH